MEGFKKFLLRGNVVDLAVAVVIGVAFGAVVAALVDGLINPIIAAVFGKPDLTGVGTFTLNDAHFSIGLVLDSTVNFVIVAAAIYFLVVLPMNTLMERFKTEPEVASETKECPQCLSSIPAAAVRCAFCTAKIA
jgi:large conductance mechanosensitive channel